MKRLFIEIGDIQNINKVSERQARNIMAKMKEFFHKEKHQRLTFADYCEYYGTTYDAISTWVL